MFSCLLFCYFKCVYVCVELTVPCFRRSWRQRQRLFFLSTKTEAACYIQYVTFWFAPAFTLALPLSKALLQRNCWMFYPLYVNITVSRVMPHTTLTHLDNRRGEDVRLLFNDFSSDFNTAIPTWPAAKLTGLEPNISLCNLDPGPADRQNPFPYILFIYIVFRPQVFCPLFLSFNLEELQ